MRGQRNTDILFIFCSFLFIVHQYLERIAKIQIGVLDNYLDPLLMMPILLWLVTFERRMIHKQPGYKLPATHMFGFVILVSFLAELVFPLFTKELIADPWDVCLYVIGGLAYALVQETERLGRG